MSKLGGLIALLFVVLASACVVTGPQPIPPGTYSAADTGERIVVTPTSIYFQVKLYPDSPDRFTRREFTHYNVEPDGSIRFVVSSNEAFTYMDFSWRWQDGKIAMFHKKSGKTTWFIQSDG